MSRSIHLANRRSSVVAGPTLPGMEDSLRTPHPGSVPPSQNDEIVDITDSFTTPVLWAGLEVPKDREKVN
jgi:hypothetical protein